MQAQPSPLAAEAASTLDSTPAGDDAETGNPRAHGSAELGTISSQPADSSPTCPPASTSVSAKEVEHVEESQSQTFSLPESEAAPDVASFDSKCPGSHVPDPSASGLVAAQPAAGAAAQRVWRPTTAHPKQKVLGCNLVLFFEKY